MHEEFFILPIERKKILKKFCVGCSCYTNFRFSNRYNSSPNGSRESKIPPFDLKSKTTSNCILRFFRKKSTFPLCFHFTILKSVIYITIHYLTISFSFCQGLPRKTAEMSVYKVVRSLILE